jgi:hypothetical protein
VKRSAESILKPPPHAHFLIRFSIRVAYSGERDQPFRLKVITDSGDRDHAIHGPQGPA